jgi:hypothetical protein
MANRLPFASHISAFSGKASGSRLPFLSHSDTKGSWPSPVRHQEEICLVSGRPTGLALGAGHGKELPRSPTRFDLKEEICMRDPLVS